MHALRAVFRLLCYRCYWNWIRSYCIHWWLFLWRWWFILFSLYGWDVAKWGKLFVKIVWRVTNLSYSPVCMHTKPVLPICDERCCCLLW